MLEEQMAKVAKAEFDMATTDLAKTPPLESLLHFYSRHDQRIFDAKAASLVKPACRAECSYCCYYKVEAKAIEVFAIAEHVKKQFTEQKIQNALEQAKRNIKEAEKLSYKEHMATNQQCPFLVENSCSIYPVRPSKCRNFHASDVARCKESYEKPTDLTIPNSYVTNIFIVSQGGSDAFEKAIELSGFDHRTYDMNSAFIEAIENPKCFKRFKNRKKAFMQAKVVQVGEAGTF